MDTSFGDGSELEAVTKEEGTNNLRSVLMSASSGTSGIYGEQQQHFNRVSSQNGRVDMAELWCNKT